MVEPRFRHGPTPTRRELEVAAAIVETGAQKLAAEKLGVTLQTVKAHVSNLLFVTGEPNFLRGLVALGWLRPPGIGEER